MNHFLKFSCSALALVCIQASAQWKWRDQNNHIQYSDTAPPSSVPANAILQRPQGGKIAPATPASAAATASAPAPLSTDPELQARRKKAEQEQAIKQKEQEDKTAATKRDNCARARAQMQTLDQGVRIVRTNEKGEREVLDDQARAQETARTREIINSSCSP